MAVTTRLSVLITFCIYLSSVLNLQAQTPQPHENNFGEISSIEKAPKIDGKLDNCWNDIKAHKIDNLIGGESSGDTDISASWRGLWTSTHMFLFVEVIDDIKLMDSPGHEYRDDQIEIFITADNKKPADYFNPKTTNTFAYENPRDANSFEGHKRSRGHMDSKLETETGWILEISIPFADLNIAPVIGDSIGIDIQVNDDDNGNDEGARDAKLAWNSLTDVNGGVSSNPLLQGTAVFIDSKK